ncbi:hypothetical protein E1160_12070 [Rhodospirillaceae bacterium RKSG073]|nr:hypothetical protein [Curvivirga aplysinae]
MGLAMNQRHAIRTEIKNLLLEAKIECFTQKINDAGLKNVVSQFAQNKFNIHDLSQLNEPQLQHLICFVEQFHFVAHSTQNNS